MSICFGKGSEESPLTADAVTACAAKTLHRGLAEYHRRMAEGWDVDEFMSGDPTDTVRDILKSTGRPTPRPAGRAGQQWAWDRYCDGLLTQFVGKVETALADTFNTADVQLTFIGAKGDLTERTRMFGELLRADKPVVSISVTGDLRDLFTTGHTQAASFSVFVYLPGFDLHAATVMKYSAQMANRKVAHRLTSRGEWIQMAGEPLVPDPEPEAFLLPESLRHLEDKLYDIGYTKLRFVADESITPAVIEAVLEHAVPAAIHGPVPVLNSAIAMVAAKHGMTVRLYGPGGRFLTPSQVSQMIWTAATDGNPDIGGLTIARDPVAALRIAQIAERGLKTGEIWDE